MYVSLNNFWNVYLPIQSIYPHPTSCRSILILSTHLCLGLPNGLLPSGFPTKTLYTPLSSPIRATCPVHLRAIGYLLQITVNLFMTSANISHNLTKLCIARTLRHNSRNEAVTTQHRTVSGIY